MFPISQIARLPEDIRLNPFDVYIIVQFLTAKEYEAHIKEIWKSLSFLPAVFNLWFLDQTLLLDNFEEEESFTSLYSM